MPDSKQLWKSKEKQDYGLIGELHQQLEKEENFSLKQDSLGHISYGQSKTKKGKQLFNKLSGLYSVMDQIKTTDTFVTAEMLTADIRKECKQQYGISSKELDRLVGDMQQGRTPDFLIREGSGSFSVEQEDARIKEQTFLSEKFREAREIDPSLEASSDQELLTSMQHGHRDTLPLGAELEEAQQFKGNRVIVKLQPSQRIKSTIDTSGKDASIVEKVQNDTKKQGIIREMKEFLARNSADPTLPIYRSAQPSQEQVSQWKNTYGLSKKDQEKLFRQIQAEHALSTRAARQDAADAKKRIDTFDAKQRAADKTLRMDLEDAENELIAKLEQEKQEALKKLQKQKSRLLDTQQLASGKATKDLQAQHTTATNRLQLIVQQNSKHLEEYKQKFSDGKDDPISQLSAEQIVVLIDYHNYLKTKQDKKENIQSWVEKKASAEQSLKTAKAKDSIAFFEERLAAAETRIIEDSASYKQYVAKNQEIWANAQASSEVLRQMDDYAVDALFETRRFDLDTLYKPAKAIVDTQALIAYENQKFNKTLETAQAAAKKKGDVSAKLNEVELKIKEKKIGLDKQNEEKLAAFRLKAARDLKIHEITQKYDRKIFTDSLQSNFSFTSLETKSTLQSQMEQEILEVRKRYEREAFPGRQEELKALIAQYGTKADTVMAALLEKGGTTDEAQTHLQNMKLLYTGRTARAGKSLVNVNSLGGLKKGKLTNQILVSDEAYVEHEKTRKSTEASIRSKYGLTHMKFHYFSYLPPEIVEDPEQLKLHHDSIAQAGQLTPLITKLSRTAAAMYSLATTDRGYSVNYPFELEDGKTFTLSDLNMYVENMKSNKLKTPADLATCLSWMDAVQKELNSDSNLPKIDEATVKENMNLHGDVMSDKDYLTDDDAVIIRTQYSAARSREELLTPFRTELKLLDASRADMNHYLTDHQHLLQGNLTLQQRMEQYPQLRQLRAKANALSQRFESFLSSALFPFLTPEEQTQFEQHRKFFQSIESFVDKITEIINRTAEHDGLPGFDDATENFMSTPFVPA